jgi:hypothetical protein
VRQRQQQQQRQLRDFEVMPAERYLDGNVPMLTKMLLARRLYIARAFSASSAVARLSTTLIWTAEYM